MIQRRERLFAALMIVCCCAGTAACGRVESANDEHADDHAGAAGVSSPTAAGAPAAAGGAASVAGAGGAGSDPVGSSLVRDYDQLTLEMFTGYGPEPCSNDREHYQLTRLPAHLTWTGCDYSKNPAVPIAGDRALSDAEVESVTKALAKIELSSAMTCGADAGIETLDVTNGSSVARYADDFYSGCPSGALLGRTFVSGLTELSNLLWGFVRS
ncbi:MAG TPA: hypothetical protein VFK05_13095 [Polyangiaceae bacterium]|nr:hypothetical protein [Polyangiaceae bacterium]